MGQLATLTSSPSTWPARTADSYGADSSDSLAERGAWGEANFIHGTLACGKIGAKSGGYLKWLLMIYTYVCIFRYIWNTKDMTKICTHTDIYIYYVYIHIYIYICICIYIYICVCIYIYIHTYIGVYICICMYIHPFIYIYGYSIYIYIYTCICIICMRII